MKKLAFLIPLALFGFSFGKMPITDYRDIYVGSYFCNRICTALSSDHTSIMNITDTATISVSKDPLDSILQIKLGSNYYAVKLKSGIMTAYPSEGHRSGKFYASDSISFNLTTGLAPSTCIYTGKKN
jgi:hypothetical protein